MEQPTVWMQIRDEELNITYQVRAYRTLTRPEMVQCVRSYVAQQAAKRRKPKANMTIKILTLIGATDRQ